MAASSITVYTRIRMPSAVAIVELAAMIVENRDALEWFRDFVDVSMKPFEDEVPCISPEQLKACVDSVNIERTR